MQNKEDHEIPEAEATSAQVSNSIPKTVLLVDDRMELRFVTKTYLENFGFIVQVAGSTAEALARFDSNSNDIVVTDNSMTGMSSVEMAHVIKMRSPSTPIIMYSGSRPRDRSSVDAVILTPSPLSELKLAIDDALSRKEGPKS